eukprot:3018155-Pyramimonas_sp.AAC.1
MHGAVYVSMCKSSRSSSSSSSSSRSRSRSSSCTRRRKHGLRRANPSEEMRGSFARGWASPRASSGAKPRGLQLWAVTPRDSLDHIERSH